MGRPITKNFYDLLAGPREKILLPLIEGPATEVIEAGKQFDFSGLYGEYLFSVTIYIDSVGKDPERSLPQGEVNFLGILRGSSYRYTDMVEAPMVDATRMRVCGLWRKPNPRTSHMLPMGSGYLEIIED